MESMNPPSEKRILLINFFLIQVFLVAISSFWLYLKKDDLWGLDDAFLSKLIMFAGIVVIVGSVVIIREINYLAYKEQEALINEVLLKQSRETVDLLRTQRHDFINHLQVVHGMLQLKKQEAAMEYIREVGSIVGSGNAVTEIDNPVLAALVARKSLEAEKNGVKLCINIHSSFSGISLSCSNLSSILTNLLDNAITHAQKQDGNRVVELELSEDNTEFLINVYNTGAPIPDEIKTRIFTKGFTTKTEEGHGFGLHIVKSLVEMHKGRIGVTSTKAEGTQFSITIPKIS